MKKMAQAFQNVFLYYFCPNHKGIGTFESRTGIYIGSWKSGLQEGNGTAIYNNGNRYDGEFLAGFKHGYGKFTVTTNNDVYTGSFDRGVRHGEVSMIFF